MPSTARQHLLLVMVLLTCIGCTTRPAENDPEIDLVITNVTAIDAFARRDFVDVLVQGENIVAVQPASVQCSAALCVDGTGKYLVPGLWDAHVHLTFFPDIDDEDFFRLALAHGITALRDTGGHLPLLARARATAGTDAAPDLFVAGPLIDGVNRVYDGTREFFPDISVGVGSADEARAKVDELAAQGVDLVKAYELLTPEAFRAVVEQATIHGLPVAAHSPLSLDALSIAASGVDDLQHLRNLEFACAEDPQALLAQRVELLQNESQLSGSELRSAIHRSQRIPAIEQANPERCADLVQAMAEHRVVQTPTLTVSTFLSRRFYAQPSWQTKFEMLGPETAQQWLKQAQAFAQLPTNPTAAQFERWALDMVAQLNDGGVPIMAGTDAPIAYLVPGASLHEELVLLVEAGLTPQQALASATWVPAQYFGLTQRRGTIAADRLADLVLLNADPLADIRHIAEIEAVVRRGRLWDRAALQQLKFAP